MTIKYRVHFWVFWRKYGFLKLISRNSNTLLTRAKYLSKVLGASKMIIYPDGSITILPIAVLFVSYILLSTFAMSTFPSFVVVVLLL